MYVYQLGMMLYSSNPASLQGLSLCGSGQVKSWQLSWSKKRSNVLEVIIGCLSFFSQGDCSMTGVMLFGGSIPLSSKQIAV